MSIISTKYLLQDAQANGYAVPAFNIHNAETIQAILEVCSEMRSPVILAGHQVPLNISRWKRSTPCVVPIPQPTTCRWRYISTTTNRWMIFAVKSTQACAVQ